MVTKSSLDPRLKICLRCHDKILHEIRAHEISTAIEIGRSSTCGWRVPSEDALISSRHATLSCQGRTLVLLDQGSKNGTWFQGQRIQERKLKEGDRVTLGHCVLTVERETEAAVTKVVAELEVLTGSHRKEHKPILSDRLSIGAAPDSDLLLTDDLVSRHHAVIIRKGEDSFWLKASNSTNGTKVNEVPLRADQERLLKDGDQIAIAHVEIVFRDGSQCSNHGQVLRRLAVMGVAGVVVLALYFGWQLVQAPAAVAVRKAQALKESGRFAEARQQLDAAIGRRGYRDAQLNADLLRTQISKCEASSQQWLAIQSNLKKSDWAGAASQLGTLLMFYNDNDAWSWQAGQAVRQQAHQIKGWLDVYLEAGHPESLSFADLGECNRQLTAVIKDLTAQKDYQGLRAAAIERQKNLSQLSQGYSGLEQALQQLSQHNPLPDPGPLLKEIEKISGNATGPVQQKALDVLPPLRQLAVAYRQLIQLVEQAQATRFTDAQTLKVELPLSDDCLIDGRLFEFRRNLDNSWANFKAELPTVAHLTGVFAGRLGSPENESAELLYWQGGPALAGVFHCDSLAGRFPKRTRTEPQGEYDRALCVEWFYASLRGVVDQRGDEVQEPPFETRLGATLRTVAAAKALVKFFPTPEDKRYWQNGRLKQWVDAARRVLQSRDAVADKLRQQARQTSGREALIAGGIAWFLMAAPDQSFRGTLAGQMAGVHSSVQTLVNQRESATASERISLRKKILGLGLPGDPIVNQMWVEASNSGSEAADQ